ncbi:MAG: tripartite-type tricarboxylate transporter receptor subunit TctC [Hyphomicrobiaceae bacterium]
MKHLFGLAVSASCLSIVFGAMSVAHAYPDKPVKLVVGFGPGGPSGIAARFMQKRFKAVTGQDLIIINKPGAGGAKAWSQIKQDPTDGYHLTLLNFPHTVLQPIARGKNAGYSYDDIQPVLYYTSVPQVIAVRKDSPFKSFGQLLKAIKDKPGNITFAGTGIGGSNHSAFYKFEKATGAKAAYVPFKDTSSTIAGLKSGAVDAAWTFTTQGVKDGDSIRMLAIASEQRMKLFPDVPTMKELGFPVVDMAWWSIGVPPGTTKEIRVKVAAAFKKVVSDKTVGSDMTKGGYVPMLIPYPVSDEFRAKLSDDYTSVGKALAQTKK